MDLIEYPTLSIVVPCYNVEHVIERSIRALLEQDYPEDKLSIIIVDDKSTDETGKIIQTFHEYEQIKIIKHLKNRGLSAARNSGIKASKSQIVGFLDGDIVVKNDWAKSMMAVLDDPNVVACMGDTKLPDYMSQENIDRFLYHHKRGVRQINAKTPIEVPGFIMGNSIVIRKVLNEVGLFDETFKIWGGEDTDLAIRIWGKYPKGLRFAKKAIGDHYHKRKLNKLLINLKQYGSTNYLLLLDRYPHLSKRLAGDWINSIKGKFILNPIIYFFVRAAYLILQNPRLIRYFIAYNVIQGARNPAEGIPRFQK